ncbi:MAG: diguanylate cyclase [Chrysiogenia bacterium]
MKSRPVRKKRIPITADSPITESRPVRKKSILIADDSPTMRAMVQEILTTAGHGVLVAEDGLQAVALAFEHDPDLIISDIEMPKMDGYQVCRLLKSDPTLVNTPVIILTSLESSGSVFWGYQTGADLYLFKDFKAEELTAAVDDLLAKYAGRRPDRDAHQRPAGKSIDAQQVLEKLNQLIDRRLFEMTLINEINRASVSLMSLSETLCHLLSVLDKAIDSIILGLAVFSGEKQVLLNLKLGRVVSPRTLELFEYHILEDLGLMVNQDIADYQIEVEVLEGAAGEAADELPFTPECVFSLPLRAKEESLGILNVYHPDMARLPASGKQLLGKLSDHISSAISAISMYNRIKSLSIIDGLTKLHNRRHVMELFKQEFNKSMRYSAEFSVLMMDIDNFKHINDTFGHLSGDLVLQALAGIIMNSIRNIDLPGRYGGEEFILLLPETSRENARVVAERIRVRVEKHPFKTVSGEPLQVSISVGLASLQPALKESSTQVNELELIKIADSRLYQAKRSGKNRVVDGK